MLMPLVSVIGVNWNGRKYSGERLNSLDPASVVLFRLFRGEQKKMTEGEKWLKG
jgi:hypothetical protein